MTGEAATPMKDALQNAWSVVFAALFLVALSIPYLSLAYFGSLLSLATILPTYFLGALTGYGWTFKRGSKTVFCGVAPVFGLLTPGCVVAFLLDMSLIVRHHIVPPFLGTTLNLFLLILSGLLVLWMVYSLLALLFAIGRMLLWRK